MRSITSLAPRHAIPTKGRAPLVWVRAAIGFVVRGREEVGRVDAERGLSSVCSVIDFAQFVRAPPDCNGRARA